MSPLRLAIPVLALIPRRPASSRRPLRPRRPRRPHHRVRIGTVRRSGAASVTLLLGFRPDGSSRPSTSRKREGFYADAGWRSRSSTSRRPTCSAWLPVDADSAWRTRRVMIRSHAGDPDQVREHPVPVVSGGADRCGRGRTHRAIGAAAGMSIGTSLGRFGSSWHALLALLDAGGLTADELTIREYPQFNQVDGSANGDVALITGFRQQRATALDARAHRCRPADRGRRGTPFPGRGRSWETPARRGPGAGPGVPRRDGGRAGGVIAATRPWFAAAEASVPTIAEDPEVARASGCDRGAVGRRRLCRWRHRRGNLGRRYETMVRPRLHRGLRASRGDDRDTRLTKRTGAGSRPPFLVRVIAVSRCRATDALISGASVVGGGLGSKAPRCARHRV